MPFAGSPVGVPSRSPGHPKRPEDDSRSTHCGRQWFVSQGEPSTEAGGTLPSGGSMVSTDNANNWVVFRLHPHCEGMPDSGSGAIRASFALSGAGDSWLAVGDAAGWPRNPRALAGRLRRCQTFLRTVGIDIAFSREGRTGSRMIRMTSLTKPRAPAEATVGKLE
jgi:hypothetical protein